MTTDVDTMALARAERADLADLLVTLEPEQWDAPTLCTQWRVRDVVAHVFSYDTLSTVALVRRFLAGRLDGDRINALGVAAFADDSTDELLALVKDHLQPHGLTAGFGGRIALTDGLVHHQDIRRALALPREVPPDRVRAALQFAPTAPPIRARKRIRGLSFVATDLNWRRGTGPVVEGPAEALLMAIAGRPAALLELSGPGVQALTARTPHR
jgi:uncharacterized protein (TIGR03083 family)